MRVCDRHPSRPATEQVHLARDDSHFDLCAECKTDLLSFLCAPREESTEILQPPVKRARQAKNSAPAE